MKRATNTLFVVLMVFLAVVFSACSYHVIESASERTVYLMNDKRWFFLTIQDGAADVCDSPLEGVSSRFQLFEPQDESVRTIEYAFGSVLFFSDEYSVLSVGTIWLEFLEQIEMT